MRNVDSLNLEDGAFLEVAARPRLADEVAVNETPVHPRNLVGGKFRTRNLASRQAEQPNIANISNLHGPRHVSARSLGVGLVGLIGPPADAPLTSRLADGIVRIPAPPPCNRNPRSRCGKTRSLVASSPAYNILLLPPFPMTLHSIVAPFPIARRLCSPVTTWTPVRSKT